MYIYIYIVRYTVEMPVQVQVQAIKKVNYRPMAIIDS